MNNTEKEPLRNLQSDLSCISYLAYAIRESPSRQEEYVSIAKESGYMSDEIIDIAIEKSKLPHDEIPVSLVNLLKKNKVS